MIDVHSHIIFDVDDGPPTLEDSISLLKMAYAQGVRKVVSTSHRRKGMFETPEEKISKNFQIVKEKMKEIHPDLELYYGGELYYSADVQKGLENKTMPTMNNSRFALIEFSSGTPWKDIHSALSNVLMLGITPLVAHIERYNALEFDEKRVLEIINMGCYTQINSSNVLKPKLFADKYKIYKKRAKFFLEKDLVHCVASDMHNTDVRPPYMKQAYAHIKKEFGKEKAEELFNKNPGTLLENHYI
ncbi:capsular polysaccharide biosynthesis protein Cps4B [Streptococcus zalophi]|uniref:Tyrosine-protein phosphatase n=1 Tax=Streptococcus zalophi TaxID=640031 RepID=A0A934P9C2_9STRE|nr:capsular polysaccharide biosynthesis protein Cps4B [Streptococcus zalophi]MBJ8349325.1 tyrosine protein phosphatase [Streptococcus zalophi]MCR8967478.1 tyrosine protein phosphatase [Streptococcus zalophi]